MPRAFARRLSVAQRRRPDPAAVPLDDAPGDREREAQAAALLVEWTGAASYACCTHILRER